MTDYINNIAVDSDIYSKWPKSIEKLAIVYVPENEEHASNLILVDSSEFYPEKQITELLDFPDVKSWGKIMWRIEGENSPVVGFEIDPLYQNIGIAKFLCVLTRTWVAEKFNSRIFAPPFFRTIEVEEILKQIAIEYNEQELLLKTTDGSYKTLKEINNIEEELGI